MKTTIVTGLLGSGKTTFIKNRVQNAGEKTVVLVNDFAAAGIDGEVFSADGIESVELPSGCVCCTLKFDLITTIRRILKEFSPDHLVIEPSGVASPTGVLEALESAGIFLYSVIGIVDVTEFSELYESGIYGSFFREQVALSDIVLVNKIDLADEGKIEETEKLIESINPRAILFRTKNAEFTENFLLPLPSGERVGVRRNFQAAGNKLPLLFEERTEVRGRGSHFQFDTQSFKLNSGTSLAVFSRFFDSLAKGHFGTVARAKALISSDAGSYRLDAVYGKVDCVPFSREINESRLVVIGQGLDREAVETELGWRQDEPTS